MDWTAVALAGSAGGIGAAAAFLIVRRPRRRPILFLVLSLAFIATLHIAGRLYILAPLNEKRIEDDLRQAIADIPVYQALRDYDRVEYDRLTGSLRDSLAAGRSRQETVAMAQALLSGLVNEYLPHADDAAAAHYVGVFVDELRQLRAHDPELCYHFVYPQDGPPVDLREYVDEPTRAAELAALAAVIRAAGSNPRSVPTAADVQADLLLVYQGLRDAYGEDVNLLGDPTAPDVDRGRICALLTSFYTNALELPDSSGGRIIRYLFSDSE